MLTFTIVCVCHVYVDMYNDDLTQMDRSAHVIPRKSSSLQIERPWCPICDVLMNVTLFLSSLL